MGVKLNKSKVAIIVVASNEKEAESKAENLILGIRDDEVLKIEDESKFKDLTETFEITELELEIMMEDGEQREGFNAANNRAELSSAIKR